MVDGLLAFLVLNMKEAFQRTLDVAWMRVNQAGTHQKSSAAFQAFSSMVSVPTIKDLIAFLSEFPIEIPFLRFSWSEGFYHILIVHRRSSNLSLFTYVLIN